jgi:hypothetical protein
MNTKLSTFLLFSAVALVTNAAEPKMNVEAFVADLVQFQKIRHEFVSVKHLLKKDARRSGKEIDVNQYFKIFDHLRMKPDTVLDWVYNYSDLVGEPLLYARHKSQKPFGTSSELLKSVQKEAELDKVEAITEDYIAKRKKLDKLYGNDPLTANSEAKAAREELDKDFAQRLSLHPKREYWNWWRESLIADGTEQSYFELAALFLLADQFALYWHANYNDLEILATKKAIKDRLERQYDVVDEEKQFIPADVGEEALKLDPTPTIRFVDQNAEVTLLTFTKWGGFQRKTLVFSKAAPHVLKSETDKNEVFWYCNIDY